MKQHPTLQLEMPFSVNKPSHELMCKAIQMDQSGDASVHGKLYGWTGPVAFLYRSLQLEMPFSINKPSHEAAFHASVRD